MDNFPSNLIEALQARQCAQRLSDGQFARLLTVHRTTWVLIKTGARPVNLALLCGVVRAFPDLDNWVLAFLRGDVP